jgi:hypothetical protein
MKSHEQLTQTFSSWGDKLLAHTDVLNSIQNEGFFKPITVQLAPCEVCDSDCAFCSVADRPLKSAMSWSEVMMVINSFQYLGAKSLEITGGGNPLLWRDGDRTISDIIDYANSAGLKVGIITNSHDLKYIDPTCFPKISWIRISLIKLDEGKEPEDYNFRGFPERKLGFSYIIYNECKATPRKGTHRDGTTVETIHRLARMVELYPDTKFIRIAGNCLNKGDNQVIKDDWRPIIDEVDKHGKFFVKDIGSNDSPFDQACYVGMVRPYVAASPTGGDYRVYICTSHVLQERNYNLDYSLCSIGDITNTWGRCSKHFRDHGFPYEVRENKGVGWCGTCSHCYYSNNNSLLHTVAHVRDTEDSEFA